MKARIYILMLAAAVAFPMMASAQNLDPTVEVSKAYEGKVMEVNKPLFEMAVPDSVLRFDLDFDYEVFENPYKGAYEFKPYSLDMQPVVSVPEFESMYLRLGAGNGFESLSLHPEADFLWTPVTRNDLKVDVYARHRSYVGEYRKPSGFSEQTGEVLDLGMKKKSYPRTDLDMLSQAGVDGRYDWTYGSARAGVSYLGIAERYGLRRDSFNAIALNAGVASKDHGQFMNYEVLASYRFGKDVLTYKDDLDDYLSDGLTENVFSLNGKLKAVLMDEHKALFEIGVENYSYGDTGVSKLTFAPHYLYRKGRLAIDAGFRIEPLIPSADSGCFETKGQFIYPDVTVDYQLVPGALKAYAKIGGGSKVNSFSALKQENHHLDLLYAHGGVLMDNTIENFAVSAGVDGRLGSRFGYNVHAGYSVLGNAPVETVTVGNLPGNDEPVLMPGIAYAGYGKAYVAADWRWEVERFRFEGNLGYQYCWYEDKDQLTGGYFLPSALKGDVSFSYNWSKRIFLGADCSFATARQKGSVAFPDGSVKDAKVPGYADLGIDFEYLLRKDLSLWFRGGNLLNMAIQRNLLYAEKGLYFSVGICLNL